MENLSGSLVKSYALRELIGMGSFGAVYRAHQPVVEREVAIKFIYPVFANHPNFIRRFEMEAQLIASLEHPHIVPLYDYWREPGGAYLVMRWLRGGHLRYLVDSHGAWEVEAVTRLLGQLAAALTFAHRHGVVHCDLKPENILLDDEANAYLSDFGVAQILGAATDGDELGAMGSPAYAAPEQFRGMPVSARSDLYSLGVILYELLTGQHPFPELAELTLTTLVQERASATLPPLTKHRPDLPLHLNNVLQRATALDPNDRYPDAVSLLKDFRKALMLTTMPVRMVGGRASPDTLIDLEYTLNPYKGLQAFQERDAANFFGRRALTQTLVERLREPDALYARFLAVVGPSGSGKSSVVKAGLLPALRRGALPGSQRWFIVEMVPGAAPFQELTTALLSVAINPPVDLPGLLQADDEGLLRAVDSILPPDPATELLLFIDQFEEVFTLVEDERETVRFLNALHAAVTATRTRLRLVITLRADFYDRPLLYPRMSELMRVRTEVVVPLSETELQEAVIEPAGQVGIEVEASLVATIIADISQQAGALPLLQYALSELFQRRDGNVLTLAGYRALGGVRGALARRADELYKSLTDEQKAAARQVFLRLITLGEGTEDTRRRASLAELTSIQGSRQVIDTVIDLFNKSRLLTFDRDPLTRAPTVEVAHEAMIREWQQLRAWLDASRNDVRLERTLANLAAEWLAAGSDASFLLQGARLEQFEKWAQETDLALTADELTYLNASVADRQRRLAREAERAAREALLEQRARYRLRILIGVLAVATIIGFSLTAVALTQSQLAQQERNRAEIARATSDANAAVSRSLALEASARHTMSEGDGDLALVLALAANRVMTEPPIRAQRALDEIAHAPGTARLLVGHTSAVLSVDTSPDDKTILTGGRDGTLRLWDAVTGEELYRFAGHNGDIESVAFSPDGRMALSGAIDAKVILWDVTTGQEIRRFLGHSEPVRAVAFSPDGRMILSGSRDTTLILWDVASGQVIRHFLGHNTSILCVAFSPDGTRLLSGSGDGHLLLWDVSTGAVLDEFVGHSTSVNDVEFSADGRTAVSASADTTLIQWDVATGAVLRRFEPKGGGVASGRLSPDGQLIAAGSADGNLHLFDVPSGDEVAVLRGHSALVTSLAFMQDSLSLVSGSVDRTTRLWKVGDTAELVRYAGHTERITSLLFTASSDELISASIDGSLRVWSLESGAEVQHIEEPGQLFSGTALAANGNVSLTLSRNGEALLWEIAQGAVRQRTRLDGVERGSVALSPDGQQAVIAAGDILIVLDMQTMTETRRITGTSASILSVAFSPDGARLLSGLRDGSLILWDVTTGQEAMRYAGHMASVWSVAFSADGTKALSGSRDGSAILWDVATGQELQRFLEHTATVLSVVFSPDARKILSGSEDGSVLLWDASSGEPLRRFDADGVPVFKVAFSPDGQHIAAGLGDGVIRVWQTLPLDELIVWTHANRYVRELTCIERLRYQVEPYC